MAGIVSEPLPDQSVNWVSDTEAAETALLDGPA
jgi:hypothetical protein